MEEAYNEGGFVSASVGFLLGAVVYTTATGILAHRHEGTRRRKRSGNRQPNETDRPGSGMALAVGALVDGVPESIAIGVSLIGGGKVALATVIAVFLSNIPEGLSSSAGMREAGRSKRYVFGLWGGIALISGVSAILGYAVFSRFDRDLIAGTIAVAAGGILAMLSSTMIPEAFEEGHEYVGIVSCLGFLCAFLLTKMG
jgi:ZIP family zinc transporter